MSALTEPQTARLRSLIVWMRERDFQLKGYLITGEGASQSRPPWPAQVVGELRRLAEEYGQSEGANLKAAVLHFAAQHRYNVLLIVKGDESNRYMTLMEGCNAGVVGHAQPLSNALRRSHLDHGRRHQTPNRKPCSMGIAR